MILSRPLCALAVFISAGNLMINNANAMELPASRISYRIDAELEPATRMLRATEEIHWTNPTDEPIAKLPVHLYLNAFSHMRTTWMRETGIGRFPTEDLVELDPDPWGHIEPSGLKQKLPEGERDIRFTAIQPDDGNTLDRSLIELSLPSPVPPGGELVMTLSFEAKLPVPIARTGGRLDYFLVGQWFPKIGVIEPKGVRHAESARNAARQFHGTTEFYADFADYDVSFTVPSGWLVGATGRAEGEPVPVGADKIRVTHKQRAVHDFALVVGKSLRDRWIRHEPKGGGPAVDVRYIATAGNEHQIDRCQRAIEGALDVFGSRVGPYPYDVLTVITMPYWASRTSGMEYPTLITSLPSDPVWETYLMKNLLTQEDVAVHEFGHQYFYGVLASNEQEESFLDEGFNSYWEGEVMRDVYGAEATGGYLFGRAFRYEDTRLLGLESAMDELREPMRKRPSWLYAHRTYSAQSYPRSAVTFATAARLFGQDKIDQLFKDYYREYAFRHPDADDFLAVAAKSAGPQVEGFLREAFERERLPDYKVDNIKSIVWKPPLGRVPGETGPVLVTEKNQSAVGEVGLEPEAREEDGRVMMEVSDPGWVRGGTSVMGTITKQLVVPIEKGEPPKGEKNYFESSVEIEGPGWDHLPLDIEMRFADGTRVRDTWDGKAAWRRYRFVRPSRLREVRIDPERVIVLDPKPQNNSRSIEPEKQFTADWGLWLGAFSQWIAGGLSLWL